MSDRPPLIDPINLPDAEAIHAANAAVRAKVAENAYTNDIAKWAYSDDPHMKMCLPNEAMLAGAVVELIARVKALESRLKESDMTRWSSWTSTS